MTLTADAARRTARRPRRGRGRGPATAAAERDEAERLLGEVAAQARGGRAGLRRAQPDARAAPVAALRRRLRRRAHPDAPRARPRPGRRRRGPRPRAASSQLELMETEAAHTAEEREEMPDERLPEPPRQGAGRGPGTRSCPRSACARWSASWQRLDADADERRGRRSWPASSRSWRRRAARLAALERGGGRAARDARRRRAHGRRGPDGAPRRPSGPSRPPGPRRPRRGPSWRRSTGWCAAPPAPRRAASRRWWRGSRPRPGYEPALAAALGSRLTAAVVEDLAAGEQLLDRSDERGRHRPRRLARARAPRRARRPRPGATRLLDPRAPRAAASRARRAPAGRRLGRRLADVACPAPSAAWPSRAAAGCSTVPPASCRRRPPAAASACSSELGRRDGLVAASERRRGGRARGARGGRARGRADRERGRRAARRPRPRSRRPPAMLAEARRDGRAAPSWLLERRRRGAGRGPEARCAAPS